MKININTLVKQSTAFNNFLRDFKMDNLSQCYMVIGEDKYFRDELIQSILQVLFCKNGPTPCGQCIECQKILNNNNLDIMYFGTEDKFTKDDASKLREECFIKPMIGDRKILVVSNADRMDDIPQNKLLKTLEELPPSVMVLLSVSSEMSLLPTIRSRSRKLFAYYDDAVLKDILKEHPLGDKITLCSNGQIKEAERLAKDKNFENYYKFAVSLMQDFPNSRVLGDKGRFFVENKKDITSILQILLYVMYDDMLHTKSDYPRQALPACIRAVARGLDALKNYANANAVIDNILLTILEERSKCK